MKRRAFLAGLAAAIAVASASAEGRMHAPYRGHRIMSSVLPLDGAGSFATPAGAYSFRKLKSTYAGASVRLRRASDNAELDIGFLGFTGFTGAPIDTAAASAFCAATICFVKTAYDQSGNARHLTQAAAASQPELVFNCLGTLPCARGTGTQVLTGPSVTVTTGVVSFSGVARSEATQNCRNLFVPPSLLNTLSNTGSGDQWIMWNGSGVFSPIGGSPGSFHAGAGVVSGAASVARLDAAENTGSLTNTPTSGAISGWGGADDGVSACRNTEAVWWDNYSLTPTERAALTANQKSFWGF